MHTDWVGNSCSRLKSRRLFYPSAGSDFSTPIASFLPYIDEFWFADINYDLTKPLLTQKDYQLNSRHPSKLSGTTLRRNEPFTVEVSSESYTHLPTSRVFLANVCCGRGYDTFRVAFQDTKRLLSVFFYRGDSPGEGGSGFRWLRKPMLKYVLAQLDPHAIIVSDGSCAMRNLSQFHGDGSVGIGAVSKSKSFKYRERHFECIGYLGERYGPTLAWSVDTA